ncbi:MAG: outer membrane beta-barrel family protein, partial [Saprospiraceae bacterium]
ESSLPSDIKINSGKIDYSGLKLLGGNAEFGIKSSLVRTSNVADFKDVVDGIKTPNYQFSNDFSYRENINSLYMNYNRDFKKITVQAGLRMENTNINGYQAGNVQVSDSSFQFKYSSLFPTFYLQYTDDTLQKHVFSLSLGRRIDRPNYKDLNPFTYPMDKFTFYGGNPFLQPTFSYNAELTHTYKSFLSTSLFYSHIDNLISETNEQRGNIYYSRPGNFAQKTSYGLSLNGTFTLQKWWTLILDAALSRDAFKTQIYTEYLNSYRWNWVVSSTNQFKISKKWNAELGGSYNSKSLSGQFLISPIGSVRAAISTKILKNKGALKLNVQDIFYTYQVEGQIRNIANAQASWFSYFDSRVVGLAFSYRFSKGDNLKLRQTGASDTEQRRVKS